MDMNKIDEVSETQWLFKIKYIKMNVTHGIRKVKLLKNELEWIDRLTWRTK